MARRVDVADLIDAEAVAEILGLAQRNTVSGYQRRYPEMPRPVVDMGRGRCKLWLRTEIEVWASKSGRKVRPHRHVPTEAPPV